MMSSDMLKALIIFLITYIMISGINFKRFRLGRNAGVLIGAVLMVAAKVASPEEMYSFVNWDTIVLLLGMMIVIEHLAEAEFFEIITEWLDRKNFSLKNLLLIEVFGVGILSAFLVNDIVCIFMTPLFLIMIRKRNLPSLPFLLGIATSSNIGSAMAFTGNPQNMIIGSLSGIPYQEFFFKMLPVGIIGLFINYFLIRLIFRKDFENSEYGEKRLRNPSEDGKERKITGEREPEFYTKPLLIKSLIVMAGIIIGFFIFPNIAWVAFAGAAVLLLVSNRNENRILMKADWTLLMFFALLFAVVGALNSTGITEKIFYSIDGLFENSLLGYIKFSAAALIGSNIFGNVPYVLIVSDIISELSNSRVYWYILAYISTIAGNLTIIGSVANVIVVEKAGSFCRISLKDFVKLGIPSVILTAVSGFAVLYIYIAAGII